MGQGNHYFRIVWPKSNRQIAGAVNIESGMNTQINILQRMIDGIDEQYWEEGQSLIKEIFDASALRQLANPKQFPESSILKKRSLQGELQSTITVKHWVPVTFLYSIVPGTGDGLLSVYHFGVITQQDDLPFFFEVMDTPQWIEDEYNFPELDTKSLKQTTIYGQDLKLDIQNWQEIKNDEKLYQATLSGATERDALIQLSPLSKEQIEGKQAFWNYFRMRLLMTDYIIPESVKLVGAQDCSHLEYVVMDSKNGILNHVFMIPQLKNDGNVVLFSLSTFERNYRENNEYFAVILQSVSGNFNKN